MLRLFCDRSRPLMTALLVAGFLLLALTMAVGAQDKPTITIIPDPKEVGSGEDVTFELSYGLPQSNDPKPPPGAITATWSSNASFVAAALGRSPLAGEQEIRWDYSDGLPLSDQIPTLTLKAGGLTDPIVLTATLIVSDTQDTKQTSAVTHTIITVPVVPPATADLSQSSLKIEPVGALQAGSPISLSVIISNTGTGPAEDVEFTLPSDAPLMDISILSESAELAEVATESDGFAFRLKEPLQPASEVTVLLAATLMPEIAGAAEIGGSIAAKGMEPQMMENQPLSIVQPAPTAAPTDTPVPTATSAPTDTPTPIATSAPTDTPAPATPTSQPPPPKSSTDDLLPLLIAIGALLFALIIGAALYFLLRGRRKPAPPPETPLPAPTSPESPSPLATTPLPTGSAFLESVARPGVHIRLRPGVTTIGRAADSAIRIDEHTMNWETVSRKHAEIRQEGGDYVIYDVSPDRRSSNGVYVEGRRTVRNVLRPGWRIGIGGVEFIFRDTAAGTQ